MPFLKKMNCYLITDRHNSFLIQKNKAITKVMEFIKEYTPTLANRDFSKIIEFDKIGIVRKGIRKVRSKETIAGNNT